MRTETVPCAASNRSGVVRCSSGKRCIALSIVLFSIVLGLDRPSSAEESHTRVGQAGLDYLKGLHGRWVVDGGDEGSFGWEFDVTSRGGVVVDGLKVGIFVCNGEVGNAKSHAELHMHGVHFQKKGDAVLIWMDMVKDGEVAFTTSYELVPADAD
jgi:hypothetical protein